MATVRVRPLMRARCTVMVLSEVCARCTLISERHLVTLHPITTPEDVLADGVDHATVGGIAVRKGTVAAFLANATALAATPDGSPEFEEIAAEIRAARPALDAIGLFEVLAVRDPRVADVLADTARHP